MGTLTYKGATAKEALASETKEARADLGEAAGLRGERGSRSQGAELFAVSGCLQCHTYLGTGGGLLGAPDLTAIGASGKDEAYFERYVANPAQFGNTVMQPYAGLGEENLQKLAAFLDASKGPKDEQVNVFLGVTGASGAPYAARLLRALTDAGCEVGLSASAAGIEVLATELYGDARFRATRCSSASPAAPTASRSTASTTTRARTRPARRRSTPTSSAPARCRRSARSRRARWRT